MAGSDRAEGIDWLAPHKQALGKLSGVLSVEETVVDDLAQLSADCWQLRPSVQQREEKSDEK
jgi:hypothetical protein